MELNLVLEQTNIRNDRNCVAETIADLLGDDDPVHFAILSDCFMYPPHVPTQLTNRVIGASPTLQLEHEKRARIVDGQNVNGSDRRRKLNAVAPGRIDVNPQLFPFHIYRAEVLCQKITQLILQPKISLRHFCFGGVDVLAEYRVDRRFRRSVSGQPEANFTRRFLN